MLSFAIRLQARLVMPANPDPKAHDPFVLRWLDENDAGATVVRHIRLAHPINR